MACRLACNTGLCAAGADDVRIAWIEKAALLAAGVCTLAVVTGVVEGILAKESIITFEDVRWCVGEHLVETQHGVAIEIWTSDAVEV